MYKTSCGKKERYDAPIEVGMCFAPEPTDDGRKFCTYCGKRIKVIK